MSTRTFSTAAQLSDARRTVTGLIASCLAILPLRQIFTDWAWLPVAWVAMALTVLPAAALRLRWAPRSTHLLPGLVLAVCYLTRAYVPDHAVGGLLPLHGSWADISALVAQFGDTIRDAAAPLDSTSAIRMMLAAQLVLVAVAIDLLAVVARRPALAGVPFLLVFTLSGAVPRHSVGWAWFAVAAAGFLLLLASDAHDEVIRWGRVMPRTGSSRGSAVRALSGRRIGVVAIVLAVLVPIVLPMRSGNVVADALHRDSNGDGSGDGTGRGSRVKLDPLATLKGQLEQSRPVTLFTVESPPVSDHEPFYLRQLVLDQFDGSRWSQSDNGSTQRLGVTQFPSDLGAQQSLTYSYQAKITVETSGGNPPVFQNPTVIDGLSSGYSWSPLNQIVVNRDINKGDSYTEQVAEPSPSVEDLQADTSTPDTGRFGRWLKLPQNIPSTVQSTVSEAVGDAATPYAKARALSDYFTEPANGFTYSLATKAGDSSNDLVNFLSNKTGFCQQYAAAMAVMLRMAGVPSRVVIGFTHPHADPDGKFTVTTRDAHAWVEAYFNSVGWLPFDPTPLTQSAGDAGRAADLSWAPHSATASNNTATSSTGNSKSNEANRPGQTSGADATAASSGGASTHGIGWPVWLVIGVLLVLLVGALTPTFARYRRRRRRLRAAAAGPDPLWVELAATAVDLGYVWSPVRTPRQVVTWLNGQGLSSDAVASLGSLATAVEQSRYAPPAEAAPSRTALLDDLRRIEGSLRDRRSRTSRIKARVLPPSLGWPPIRWTNRH